MPYTKEELQNLTVYTEFRDKLRQSKKNKKDVSKAVVSATNRLERYRVPEDLIYSLFLE